jgi:hypothetical protein
LVEQELAPRLVQVLRGSGAPAATFRHWPGELGRLQLRQEPVQALSQQTLSTHWLDSQSLAFAQGCPGFFLPQVPEVTPFTVCDTHWCPARQSASPLQL